MDQEIAMRVHDRTYVPVFINEAGPFWLLLDTGCVGSFITRRVAEMLALEVGEDGNTCLRTFAIGSARCHQLRFGVSDDPSDVRLPGPPFDGFLGNAFIYYVRHEYEVTIDYPRETVAFRSVEQAGKQNDERRPSNSITVPITLENHFAIVPAHINGEGPYRFLLDTGASRCVVSPQVAHALSLAKGEPCQAKGTVGSWEAYRSRISELSVGNAACKDLEVIVLDCSDISGYVHDRLDGLIGHDFVRHFSVTLGYRNEVVLFR